MAHETEIKLRIGNAAAFLKKLKKLGAKPAGRGSGAGRAGRVHEQNVIFDTPQGGLAKHGQLLRIRTERTGAENAGKNKRRKAGEERVLLTFKAPARREPERAPGQESRVLAEETPGTHTRMERVGRHKVREEIEVEVADAETLSKILQGLGLKGWFRYEKYRTTYKLPASARWAKGLLCELDETPIGTFVELEGPPAAIDRAASLLGFSHGDYILKTYLQLYLEDCRRRGEEPRDMLFTITS